MITLFLSAYAAMALVQMGKSLVAMDVLRNSEPLPSLTESQKRAWYSVRKLSAKGYAAMRLGIAVIVGVAWPVVMYLSRGGHI